MTDQKTRDYATSVAQTAMNILDGTEYHAHWDALQAVWERDLGVGFDGFCNWIAQYAVMSEDLLAARNPQDFPGVYDYEVSFELGHKIRRHMMVQQSMPSHVLVTQWLTERANQFFSQGEYR